MLMNKVVTWDGMTKTHGFHIDVFRDSEGEGFVAQIQTYSPPLVPQKVPGTPIQMMNFDDQVELRHKNLDQLRELTKQLIISRCGKILQFIEN